jgi:hypothetical protein
METSPRYLQRAAYFGDVDGPSVCGIHIILGFAYKPGTRVPRAFPLCRQSADKRHHEGLDNRTLEKVSSLGRWSSRFALNV